MTTTPTRRSGRTFGSLVEFGKKKLSVGENVEVRHFDKGLRGSWAVGVVIKSEESVRHVEYAELLCEDGSSKLIEAICVSPAVDGTPSSRRTTNTFRGNIRPSPPCFCIESSKLCYGLCVDALIKDGWWEGVVFDHEEGAGKRLIFFPDEGDQQMVDVNQLRVSQDWDEGSGKWKHRGDWLFLDSLKKTKQWGSFPVSIRQIWYDVRLNYSCLKRKELDWTCRNKSLWEKLIHKAIEENALAASGRICSFSDCFPKKYLAALKRTKKNSKSLVLASSGCLGGQMDQSNPHAFNVRDKAKVNLAPGRSKKIKTVVPQNFASMGVSVIAAEEPFTCREDECIGQGKISLPILVSQSGMGATTSEHGFQVRSMDVIDDEKGQYHNILSAPTGWCHAGNIASQKHLANAARKTRKSCTVQSSTRTSVSGDEMVDHVIHQRLQNSNECAAQKNHLCHDVLGFHSETNAAARETNIQVSGLNSCGSCVDNSLTPSSQAMLAFQFDVGSCPPICPEALPESLSFNCRDNGDGKCCTYSKEREVNGQRSGNADGSMAYHSSCKFEALHFSVTSSEPACLIKESIENARVARTSLYKAEHSGCIAQVVLSNPDAKAHGMHQGTGQSFTQTMGVDGPSDPDVQQAIPLPEVLDELQDAEDERCLVEENRACESLEPEISVGFGLPCPEDVIYYYYNCKPTGRQNGISKIRSKVKMLLLADGWDFGYPDRDKKQELRYRQPNGRCFYSLRTACKAWMEANGILSRPNVSPTCEKDALKISRGPSVGEKAVNFVKTASTCFKLQRSTQPLHEWPWSGPHWSLLNIPGSSSVRLTGARKCRRRRNFHSDSTVSQRLPCEMNSRLLPQSATAENVKPSGLPMPCGKTVEHFLDCSSGSQKQRKHKLSTGIIRHRRSHNRSLTCVLRSSKRAPRALVSSSSQPRVRAILSWLIDNEVVLPRQKVCYMHGKDPCVLAKGQITSGGIKCKCCKKVFSLTGFGLHAGSSNRRPAAHIFLEDGRSLLECQIKLLNCEKLKGLGSDTGPRMKRDCHHRKTDNICSICHYGGKLVLCDYCPSTFHLSCINLKEVPEGSWACPTCQCGICGKGDFDGNSEQFTPKTVLYCDQCEREYHVGCLRKRGTTGLESCPDGNWCCNKICSKIFMRMQKNVGKRKQTNVAGLSCMLLRPRMHINCSLDTLEAESTVELHSKLSVALSILHECFVPITEPRTQRDIVTDVIFNQWSELKRLNFRGFYAMVLERGDEMISVATVRIHGEKVAEMPLIGTCVQYRQQGMCRLLVNELEKMLFELGVERLLLPATSQMLPKWTASFGFTQIMPPERLRLLEYTFLDFQGTTMCQKVLQPPQVKTPKSRPSGKRNKAQDDLLASSDGTGSGKQSSISEVTQTVEPVLALLSMDAQVHPLHDDHGTVEEIMGHSSLSNGRSSSEELSNEEKLQKSIMAKQESTRFSTDSVRSDTGIVEIFPGNDVVQPKQRSAAPEKTFVLFYRRKRKLDIMRKHKESSRTTSTERKDINRFVNHYKRRRMLSSIQRTG